MKKPWIPLLLVALPVAGAAAAWVVAASDRSVLNFGEPALAGRPKDPAAELLQMAREGIGPRLRQAALELRSFDLRLLDSRPVKLAFWINLYNALTRHALLAFRVRRSVWEVPGFFQRAAYDVGGYRFSLHDIEHGVLRANRPAPYSWRRPFSSGDPRLRFALRGEEFDPRIHFALNCGARSCPAIASYQADRIDAQLDGAARSFLQGETEVLGDRVVTSALLRWYREDLGEPRELLRRYLSPEDREAVAGQRITFRKYDWGLAG